MQITQCKTKSQLPKVKKRFLKTEWLCEMVNVYKYGATDMVKRNNPVFMYKIISSDFGAPAQERYIKLLWVVLWKDQDQLLSERQIAGTKY